MLWDSKTHKEKQWQEQAVTRSADQSVIELFLNVCQFKNRVQKYALEVGREGGGVNSEHFCS